MVRQIFKALDKRRYRDLSIYLMFHFSSTKLVQKPSIPVMVAMAPNLLVTIVEHATQTQSTVAKQFALAEVQNAPVWILSRETIPRPKLYWSATKTIKKKGRNIREVESYLQPVKLVVIVRKFEKIHEACRVEESKSQSLINYQRSMYVKLFGCKRLSLHPMETASQKECLPHIMSCSCTFHRLSIPNCIRRATLLLLQKKRFPPKRVEGSEYNTAIHRSSQPYTRLLRKEFH